MELLRGSEHLSHVRPKVESANENCTKLKQKFNSIQFLNRQERTTAPTSTTHKRAETISHVRAEKHRVKENEDKTKGNLEGRLKTFMAKYKSNYHLEKNSTKDTDLQHRHIEEIANQLAKR